MNRADAAAHCNPGDHLIGEDARFIYCSRITCDELEAQLKRDKRALRREQDNILASNSELQAWTTENQKAQAAALREAERTLRDALLGWVREWTEAKLEQVEAEFRRRAPFGETWNTKLEKVRDLRFRVSRLSGQIDGLELSRGPITKIQDASEDLHQWAQEANRQVDSIAAEFNELRGDPEARAILVESGAHVTVDTLKLALSPMLAEGLELGSFLVNYGYDAKAWSESRQRIVQNVENESLNLKAVCKLSEQLKKTVRDVGVCHGRYPDPSQRAPDPANCH